MEHQDQQLHRMKPPEGQNPNHHHQPPPPQKCPRCESSNTKFCYYNNYSLSQPRYFCKACRRYWTHGGTLRNVPVGGGCRKSKRPKPSSSAAGSQPLPPAYPSQSLPPGQAIGPLPPPMPPVGHTFYSGASFLSTLAGMQSAPLGGAAAGLGGGNGQYDALLQALKPQQPPQQFQVHNEFFQSRPPLTWTQSFINRGPAPTSAAPTSSDFWSGAAAAGGDGNNQASSSSFNPNHWPENNHGYDGSQ